MNALIEKINKFMEKRKYDIIYHDRKQLTDSERDQWIPEIKFKLEAIKKYFGEIISLCDIQENSPVFNQAVQSVINPRAFPQADGSPSETPATLFFRDIRENCKSQGVDPIDEILEKYKIIKDVRQFRLFINEVNIFCLAILTVKNKLLLYKIETYPFLSDMNTQQTFATMPIQYSITIEPFQILITNIIGVAEATSGSIAEWVSYSQKLKSQYWELNISRLNVRNTEIALYVNIFTVILAMALSATFLFANDPFNLFKENQKLKRQNTELNQDNARLQNSVDLFLKSKK